ncbi:DUF448 domain-containing protein [Pseudanabaena sp. UWO311]|uniref:YlxR family protein n=1 Tax=Pseudanabaena sp. UWO311 TaxID=2487337 RepID=UPI00115BC8C0|nr:YlxR family protein [Pseudanabaena sp. UWO311]TYQ25680.1 DUF448 domain-containing protein [Pseudanabaena sp. UWO311]
MALKLLRRCVSCQCIASRDTFWRVVRVPIASTDENLIEAKSKHDQNQIQLDHGMGRSAYLCKKLECLQLAQKKNRLGRSLRTQIPPEIFDILKSRL